MVMCMRSKVMTGFITFPVQHTPWSRVECAISPLLRRQKPLYCLFFIPLSLSPSLCPSVPHMLHLSSLSLFFTTSLAISLFLLLSEGNDDHLQPSCPLTSGDGLGHNNQSAHMRTHAHTHTHGLSLLYRKQCSRKKKRQGMRYRVE